MYDTVKYDYTHALETNNEIKKLVPNVEVLDFQTKDLDNCLSTYHITKEGRLLYKDIKYKWVDDDNAFLKGYMDEESYTLKDMNYHGDLEFYSYDSFDQSDGTQLTLHLEYKARFSNGTMENINLLKYSIKDTTDNKKAIDELFRKSRIIKSKWYNKYFFSTKTYNNLVRRKVLWLFRQLNNFTQNTYYFISRHL